MADVHLQPLAAAPDALDGQPSRTSWDDIRAFLAVAAHGSMNRAARALGESQATVGRRMSRLERALGVRLLERGVNRTALLPAGKSLLRSVAPMPEAASEIDAAVASYRKRTGDPVRLTTTNSVALFLTRHIAALSAMAEPRRILLLPSRRPHDLMRGEADIALRMRQAPEHPGLVARKVGDIKFAAYAVADDASLPMIMPSEQRAVSKMRACAMRIAQTRTAGPEIDELHLRLQAVRSGVGVGLLPCWLGDSETGLVRVNPETFGLVSDEMFLVRTAESKADPVVSRLADGLTTLLRVHRHALSGQSR
jgi:DNA-binding transcriptional LysR family regulator